MATLRAVVSPAGRFPPLRATFCFSIEHARPRDAYVKTSNDITSSCFAGNAWDFKIQRSDANENVKKKTNKQTKSNRFNKQKNTFTHASHIFFTVISPFADNVNKQRRNFACFFFLNLDMVPRNSTLGGFAYICGQSKLLRLKERKFTACSR